MEFWAPKIDFSALVIGYATAIHGKKKTGNRESGKLLFKANKKRSITRHADLPSL